MEFGWTETHTQLYDHAFQFASEVLSRRVAGGMAAFQLDKEAWQRCAEQGLTGLAVPEAYGGTGLDALSSAYVMEALGRGCQDMGTVLALGAHLYACAMPICEEGDNPLKRRVLPKLCSGEWTAGNAVSEAEAGSDLAALKTRADKDGDGYVLNGEKCFVTNGPVADVFLVYASTNPSHGYMGVSAFVVERDRAGLATGKPFVKMGLSAAPTSYLYLSDCRIPAGNRVGAEGAGLSIFNRSMNWERTGLFAGFLGAMQQQFDTTVDYAKTRRQFRKPIGRQQAVAHRIADMKLDLEAARLLLYRACWLMDRGESATLAASLAKLAVSESAIRSGLAAIRIHGGLGTLLESGVPQGLVDAVPSSIFSGTSDMQRNIIARELGL